MRGLAFALAITVSSAACAHASPSQRATMIVTGVGLALGGYALQRAILNEDGTAEEQLTGLYVCAMGGCVLSLGAMATGSVLAIAGFASGSEYEEEPEAPALVPIRAEGPPGGRGEVEAAPPTVQQQRPLPEVAADERTLQLAKQVRSAAFAGDCDAVERTLAAILERDPRYHTALLQSSVVAGCR
jgi:hypothetical protein